jgi:hypothetical protein
VAVAGVAVAGVAVAVVSDTVDQWHSGSGTVAVVSGWGGSGWGGSGSGSG